MLHQFLEGDELVARTAEDLDDPFYLLMVAADAVVQVVLVIELQPGQVGNGLLAQLKGVQIKDIVVIFQNIVLDDGLNNAPVKEAHIAAAGDGVVVAEQAVLGQAEFEEILAAEDALAQLLKAVEAYRHGVTGRGEA